MNNTNQVSLYFVIEKDLLFASELQPVDKAKADCSAKNCEELGNSINFAKADLFERFICLIE